MCSCSKNDPKARLLYQIAVMQGAADAKEIQFRLRGESNRWEKTPDVPLWNWAYYDYRVKPRKPRELWINEYSDQWFGRAHDSEEKARAFGRAERKQIVKVREVIEDEPTCSVCTCGGK